MDLDLDILDDLEEEEQEVEKIIVNNNFNTLGDITAETDYRVLDLFSDDKWRRLRYYLDNILNSHTIGDINNERNRIVNDLLGLGVFNEQYITEFNQRLDDALRLIELFEYIKN